MLKYFTLLMVVLMTVVVSFGCKSTKQAAYSAAGNWKFHVSNTPNGDYDGKLVLSKTDNGYTGYLEADGSQINLSNIVLDEENKLTADFSFSGNDLKLKGIFTGDAFAGFIVAGYDNYPMAAERTK
ncbi:MAG: hypothetical protein SF052_22645 [Bacteroidia bacterium]|nr:hypothetical protein [Bacteroidia bacterium]